MKIKYFGHSCFAIYSDSGQILLTDPYDEKIGYKLPDIEPDVVTVSHSHYDHNNTLPFEKSAKIVDKLIPIMIGDFAISCIQSYHDDKEGEQRGTNRIYKIIVDGISIVHLGDLGHPIIKEMINLVDILLIPIGGIYTLDPEQANDLIHALQPKAVIPMHYRTPQVALQQIADLKSFLSIWEGDVKHIHSNELDIDKFSLDQLEEIQVVTLEIE